MFSVKSWVRRLRAAVRSSHTPTRPPHRTPCRLRLEWLEDRTTPAAGAGSLDPLFGIDGKVTTDFGLGLSSNDFGTAVQADGKIVVVGDSYQAGGYDFAVARYNPDGTLDAGFGTGGKVLINFGSTEDHATGVAVDGYGRVVVVGRSYQSGTGSDFAVARLTSAGKPDATFSGDGLQTVDFGQTFDFASGVAVQADGRVVVAGSTNQPGTGADFAVARLTSAGELDATFSGDGRQTVDFGSPSGATIDIGSGVAVQVDGKVVVVGSSYQSGTGEDFAMARLTSTGELDATFSGDGRQTIDFGNTEDFGAGVAVQADGKVVVAGRSDQPGHGTDFAVARLTSSGELDATFSGDGRQTIDFGSPSGPTSDVGYGVVVDGGGNVLVAGHSSQPGTGYDFAVARLTPAGELDATFSGDGRQTVDFGSLYDFGFGVAVDGNGNVVVAGQTDQPGTGADFAVARLLGASRQVRPLTDLSREFKAGRTIPITLQLTDALGTNLSAPDLDLTALKLVGPTGTVMPVPDAGRANPGGLFRYDAALGGYIFNLNTKGLAAGKYTLYFQVEGDSLVRTLTFELV